MTQLSERFLVQAHLAAKQPKQLTAEEEAHYRAAIATELKARDAVLVAHYYCDPVIQALAEETGGCVSDSLEMARFGNQHPAQTVVVAGVRFMGETAKILNPEKRVLMPTLEDTLRARQLAMPGRAFEPFAEPLPARLADDEEEGGGDEGGDEEFDDDDEDFDDDFDDDMEEDDFDDDDLDDDDLDDEDFDDDDDLDDDDDDFGEEEEDDEEEF